MMDSKLWLPSSSTTSFHLAVALLILLLRCSSSQAFNITQILSQYPDLSAFSDALTHTQVASQINSRQTLTVLAVSNGAMSGLPSSQDAQTAVLGLHVILDYYDPKKLQGLPDKSTTLTTLYQASGLAKGMQGFLNVSVTNGGVEFGSAVPGASFVSSLVKSIVARPYNISVLQVSSLVVPPNLGGHTNPAAPLQSQGATTSASSSAPGTTPGTPTTNAPATGPPKTAETPTSAAGGSTTPSAGGGTTPSSAGGGTTPSSVGGGTTPSSAGGGTTPSSAGGGTIPSSAAGAIPPSAGGGTTPSSAAGATTPLAGGGTTPSSSAGATPPSAGGGTTPSSSAGATPPSSAGTETTSASGATPPSGSSASAPSDSGTSSTVVANATADSPADTTNPTGAAEAPAVSTPLPTAAGPVADAPAGATSAGKRSQYSLNHVILQIMSLVLIRPLARNT